MGTSIPKTNQWWRWPIMPFAAVGGATAGSVALGLVTWVGMKMQGGYAEDGWFYRFVLPVMLSGAFGYIYAKIAYHVAPSGKMVAAIVMVTLLGLLVIASTVLGWILPAIGTADAIRATVATIATIVGALIALADPE